MKKMQLLFSTSFPLAVDEKVEIKIPITHANGAGTYLHPVTFQVDTDFANKSDIKYEHEQGGGTLVLLPNHRGNYYFNPLGYGADSPRKLFLHFTIQSIEGCNIVQVCLMEHE